LAAAVALAALLWWQHLQRDPFRATLEAFLFVASPIALLISAEVAEIPLLQNSPQTLPAVLGAIYVLTGWQRRSANFLIMGFALAAFAVVRAWDGPAVAIGWTALSLAALAAERNGGRPGGRHASTALASAAFLCLFSSALSLRAPSAPVFTDSWALALYLFVAATAAAARWWGVETAPALWRRGGTEWLWILCAAAVFAGGSIQFHLAFGRAAVLAGDLALSVWWLLYAGALVWLGFRLDRKMIRSAGLMVAAAAGFKIVLYDLSTMDALYRVGSFFALALIALAVAYAYNRRARVSAV
jgi:hypothetical protein